MAVRPYNNLSGGVGDVYITVSQTSLCSTNIFYLSLAWGGAKESVTAAMVALISGKEVQIEVSNAGCAVAPYQWMTGVQFIYLE